MRTSQDYQKALARGWRLLGLAGLTDAIFNHISVSWLDDHQAHWMGMNPGNKCAPDVKPTDIEVFPVGGAPTPNTNVNPDGFELHREIHRLRGAPGVALHTHSPFVAAVSAMECGLQPLSQAALEFVGETQYLDYQGLFREGAFSDEMRDFARRGGVAILRNHGDLIVCSTIDEAVYFAYYLEEACRIQCLATGCGASLIQPTDDVLRRTRTVMSEDRRVLASRLVDALCVRLGV